MSTSSLDLKIGSAFRHLIVYEAASVHGRHGSTDGDFLDLADSLAVRLRVLDWEPARNNDQYNAIREMTLLADCIILHLYCPCV